MAAPVVSADDAAALLLPESPEPVGPAGCVSGWRSAVQSATSFPQPPQEILG